MSYFVAVTGNYFGLGTSEEDAIKASHNHSGKQEPIHVIYSAENPITVTPGMGLLMQAEGGVRNTAIVKWSRGKIVDRREIPKRYQDRGAPYEVTEKYIHELQG